MLLQIAVIFFSPNFVIPIHEIRLRRPGKSWGLVRAGIFLSFSFVNSSSNQYSNHLTVESSMKISRQWQKNPGSRRMLSSLSSFPHSSIRSFTSHTCRFYELFLVSRCYWIGGNSNYASQCWCCSIEFHLNLMDFTFNGYLNLIRVLKDWIFLFCWKDYRMRRKVKSMKYNSLFKKKMLGS